MKKTKLISLFLIFITMVMFVGCGRDAINDEKAEEKTTKTENVGILVAALKGPTGMGMAGVIDTSEKSPNDYTFKFAASPDQLVGEIINGTIDIAAVPTNLASTLYQKTNGAVQVIAVNTLGVLYIMENGKNIQSLADLSGCKILTAGQGTTAEYTLNYLLEQNGLYIDENITVEFAKEHSEVAAQAQAGNYDVIVLPEPFVTSLMQQDSKFRVAIDLTEEWGKTGAGQLSMGCLITQKSFAEKNPEALATFMKEYEASVEYVNSKPKQAAKIMEENDIIKAVVAEKSIPNCNIVCTTGKEMKNNLELFYNILLKANPQSIGGSLPPADFYLTDF